MDNELIIKAENAANAYSETPGNKLKMKAGKIIDGISKDRKAAIDAMAIIVRNEGKLNTENEQSQGYYNELIKRSAAELIGNDGSDYAIQTLAGIFNDKRLPAKNRSYAASGLGETGSDIATDILVAGLADNENYKDKNMIDAIAWALHYIGSIKSALGLVQAHEKIIEQDGGYYNSSTVEGDAFLNFTPKSRTELARVLGEVIADPNSSDARKFGAFHLLTSTGGGSKLERNQEIAWSAMLLGHNDYDIRFCAANNIENAYGVAVVLAYPAIAKAVEKNAGDFDILGMLSGAMLENFDMTQHGEQPLPYITLARCTAAWGQYRPYGEYDENSMRKENLEQKLLGATRYLGANYPETLVETAKLMAGPKEVLDAKIDKELKEKTAMVVKMAKSKPIKDYAAQIGIIKAKNKA